MKSVCLVKPCLITFLALAVLARPLAAAGATKPLPPSHQPNVILVLTDDQGYGDLGCHGNPRLKTPNIDQLYHESIRLTDFHVAPICTPSRSQLMSGCDALANGAMNASSGRAILRRDLPTMADVFGAGGYRTAMFGKWHLGHTYPYRPHDRGFEEAIWFPVSMISSIPDAWGNDYYNDRYRHKDDVEQYEGYCTDVFFREAMQWIERQHARGQRFFVYLPLNAAHYMYWVEEKYREPYKDLQGNIPSFFGMIANIDENMGYLERMLRDKGLRDDTLLIFMTDNGSAVASGFYNAGMRGRKFQLWEGGHRVPCFIRWPNGQLRPPGDVAGLTECQDLLPTLIDLCGLQAPKEARFDGISLAPVLRSPTATLPDRMLVVQFSRPNLDPAKANVSRPRKGDAAVLWKHWRLVEYEQLYDLRTDPKQRRNVAKQHPEIVARMQAHYDRWWQRVDPRLDSFEPMYIGAPQQNPTLLTADTWGDPKVWIDQSEQVRRGENKNGVWTIEVVAAGSYELSLRRWPPTIAAPLCEGLPKHEGELGSFEPGVALPIAKARLKIGSHDVSLRVGKTDESAEFEVSLPRGPTKMQTWFYDGQGRELCGAYYVVVTRK